MSRSLRPIIYAVLTVVILNTSYLILNTAIAHAQSVPSSFGVDLVVSASNPVPGQNVTITAQSYTADINSSKVSWSVNGKVVQSGTGLTKLTVTAPALGKKLSIVVNMTTSSGLTMSGNATISSGSVDMIIETNGYVPPSFLGKLPIIYQNSVKIVAMPHIADSSGVEYDPKTLVYQWKKNDQPIQDQSGYGKQSVTLVGDIIPRPYDLSVTVSTRDNSGQAEGIINISPQSPTISFYVNDPLYGPMFNSAVGDTFRIGSQRESDILAIPYGFNKPSNGLGDLSLTWMINGVEHPELASNDSVVLRAPEGTAGSSNIELNVTNNKQILQGTSAGFSALFAAGSSNATSSINY